MTDDIISFSMTDGDQNWSSVSQLWHGALRRNMGMIRMAQDAQTFEDSEEAMVMYLTDDSITYPQFRRWNGTSWSNPLSTNATR